MRSLRPLRAMPLVASIALVISACDAGGPASAKPPEPTIDRTRRAPAIRVRVATAEVTPLAGTITVPGVVHPFQKAAIAAKIPGRVIERLVEPGDTVAEGDRLLRLDETDLELAVQSARIAVRAADVDVADAKRELDRGRRLGRQNTISKSELDRLQAVFDRAAAARARAGVSLATAEQALADATVRAPFAGSVEQVDADVGEYLQPGAPVATLVDFSKARVRAGVTATEAAQIAVGQPADMGFDTLGGAHVSAAVRSIARVADPGSGTYAVELWLEAPDPRLREGMIGEVHMKRIPGGAHPVVPRAALLRRAGRMTLFVVDRSDTGTRARERVVRSGRNDGDRVEIVDGVDEGDQVVIDGHFALGDGALIAIDDDAL